MNAVRTSGKMKDKAMAKYEAIHDEHKEKMKGYSHKDQKQYWHLLGTGMIKGMKKCDII